MTAVSDLQCHHCWNNQVEERCINEASFIMRVQPKECGCRYWKRAPDERPQTTQLYCSRHIRSHVESILRTSQECYQCGAVYDATELFISIERL